MWLLVAREPRPDAAYWPGRRLLAALDALLWPALWVWVLLAMPAPTGLIGPFFTAVAVWCAVGRLRLALWVNHRYVFTTWRWGRVVAALWLMGIVIQLSARG